jgi:hypothetical protein
MTEDVIPTAADLQAIATLQTAALHTLTNVLSLQQDGLLANKEVAQANAVSIDELGKALLKEEDVRRMVNGLVESGSDNGECVV